MYSEKVMDHFQHPRNVGEIENASGVGTVGNAKCGDIMRMFLDIDDKTHIIKECKFKTFGCGAAVATSSMATEMVKGKTEATVLGGWTWNINTNCKNPELAYDLIQYLNSEKGDSLLGVEGKISARKDFDYDKALEGNDKLKVFTEEFPYTEARPAVINEKSIDELITNAILEVDYGQSSAEDALTSLTQKLNENIASNYQ